MQSNDDNDPEASCCEDRAGSSNEEDASQESVVEEDVNAGKDSADSKKYKCDVCDKAYRHKSDMKRHRRVHDKVLFKCSHCSAVLSSQDSLEKHEMTKHGMGSPSVGEHFLAQLVLPGTDNDPSTTSDVKQCDENVDITKGYQCEVCEVRLKDKRALERHKKIHTESQESAEKPKGYPCELCDERFRDKRGLERHTKQHSKPHVCVHCRARFVTDELRKEHEDRHSSLKQHTCESCSQVYSSARNLKRHQLTHANVKQLSCPVCSKEFTLEKNLKSHMKKHEQTTCQDCTAVFDTELELHSHTCTLHCQFCDEMFASRPILDEHVLHLHPSEDPDSAGEDNGSDGEELRIAVEDGSQMDYDGHCAVDDMNDEDFESKMEEVSDDEDSQGEKSEEEEDLENGVSDEEKILQENDPSCLACGATFPTAKELKAHMLIHASNRSFGCMKCNKNFTTMTNLRRHLQHHEKNTCKMCGLFFIHAKSLEIHDCGYTPYCNICHRPFNSKREYRLHMSTHGVKEEDDKSECYKCPDCGKSFAKFMNFRAHRASHTGEKPFICRDCGEGFLSATALRIHRRTHTGKKYFSCEQCDATFVYEFKLRQHLLTHKTDAEMPFHCPHCHQGFVAKSGLLRHEVVCQSQPGVNKEESAEAMRKQRLYNRSKVGKNPNKKCEECGETFLRYDQFLLHMRTHNEQAELPLKCSYCVKGFVHEYNRRQHERFCMKRSVEEREERLEKERDYNLYKTFKGQKVFKCTDCKQMFRYRHKFLLHLETHKSDAEKPFHCPLCQGGFVSRSGLKRHGMHCANRSQQERGQRQEKKNKKVSDIHLAAMAHVEEDEKCLWCAGCGEGFTSKQDLSSHRALCQKAITLEKKDPVVVSTLKDYKCPICTRVFHFSHILKLHMDAHKGLYPFECKMCSRGFTLKSSFLLHKCIKVPGVKQIDVNNVGENSKSVGKQLLSSNMEHGKIKRKEMDKMDDAKHVDIKGEEVKVMDDKVKEENQLRSTVPVDQIKKEVIENSEEV